MAVLTLLLDGNPQARSIAELADVVARHNAGPRAGISGRAVPHDRRPRHGVSDPRAVTREFVRELHPDAPVPGFYLAEGLFRDAKRSCASARRRDFFEQLNAGKRRRAVGASSAAGGTRRASRPRCWSRRLARSDAARGRSDRHATSSRIARSRRRRGESFVVARRRPLDHEQARAARSATTQSSCSWTS